ncbi:MAG: heme ABC exporter ATP-binding protein CcmA [Gammaproteobacteria bacterium]|nr:heme ABC exporter ATP-binding protein CcmA [Gammaproteobacteria bacterium]
MLVADHLTARRGSTWLFAGLGFSLGTGEALLLQGANGTGKTTLLRILCGLSQPESGHVCWQGIERREALRGLAAYAGHLPGLSHDLTVEQNLQFYAGLDGWPDDAAGLVEELGLMRCYRLEIRQLSAGQRRRAALARVLSSRLPVWLLDEPFTHLDADGRRMVERRLAAHLSAGGIAVVALHGELRLAAGRVKSLVLGSA